MQVFRVKGSIRLAPHLLSGCDVERQRNVSELALGLLPLRSTAQ